ncbi:uncharacterized protein isoform X2 [Leptinotarsa decemlineata]|uniref:uncharacterized protein isoform X2 n=1 Tax=Leptinotarsa decemlineata TaxID=7539 RepID=UPI003D30B7AE
MSNSVVRVTDIKDDELDNSLLLLVGEDGTVTPDQDTVETFLKQRSGPTNIQIMKFNQSEKQGIDITVNNVTYIPDAINEEVVRTNSMDMEEVARNLRNFKLDHDYTLLMSPRNDSPPPEDELAKALSILDGPDPALQMPPLSMSEPPPLVMTSSYKQPIKTPPKVKLIQSITIAPPNKSNKVVLQKSAVPPSPVETPAEIVKPVVEQKVVPEKPQPPVTPSEPKIEPSSVEVKEPPPQEVKLLPVETPPKTKAKIIKTEAKIAPKPERPKPAKAKVKTKEVIEEESDDYDDFVDEMDLEMEDDKDDSDYDFEEELKVKQTPRRVSRRSKAESKGTPRSPKRKKSISSDAKEVKEAKKEIKEVKEENPQEKPIEDKPPSEKPVEEPKPIDKKPPKKEKKVIKPILDDFALFSTPDIIRRVGGKEPLTPMTPEASSPGKPAKILPQEPHRKSVEAQQTPVKNRTSVDGRNEKEKHSHNSPEKNESRNKERRSSMGDMKPKRPSTDESAKFKEKKPERRVSETSRRKSVNMEDIPSAEDIRSIIMNEDTKSFTMDTMLQHSAQNLDQNNINLDGTGLDLDPTLLDNLNNDEISEDILYQVAQSLVSNPELQNAIDKGINEGVLDPMTVDQNIVPNHSHHVQASNEGNSQGGTQVVRADGRIVVIPPIERPTTRSRNKRNEESKPPFKPVHKPLDEEHVSGNELDSSNDEEEESEDDPNKLWCICNQPHNNRFMICCDTCEEWYHGKCVNITKAMGQQMESEGREWICLFCKDPMLKRPQAAARRVRRASRNSRASIDSVNSERGRNSEPANAVPCVVCQKQSRKNSIYCSETCILAHAQGIERVIVFERATGKMITGNKAPSTANLDQWLKEHPGYEVVRSGGKVVTAKAGNLTQSRLKLVKNVNNHGVSLAIQKKGVSVGVLAHSPKHPTPQQQQTKAILKATITGIKPLPSQDSSKPKEQVKTTKLIPAEPLKVIQPATPSKTKQAQSTLSKTPQQSAEKKQKTPASKEKVAQVKEKAVVKKKEEPATVQPSPKPQENIRENVQKTIFEQLTSRLKANDDLKLSEEEVKTISANIETQLFRCFGDTGQKYRNKYRSLIFNIKDAKNQTLWRRICEKAINPYELVRLSPDDLASQELALWREREAKHSLDMIKKSELELLNCNRQYVLKTHKGEQVVEDDRVDKIDNTEVIKSLTEGAPLDSGELKKDLSKDNEKKSGTKNKERDRDRKSGKDKEHRLHRSSSKDDRDRSRKRSKSRDHKHSEHKKHSKSKDHDRDRYRKSSHKTSRHKKDIVSSTDKLDKKSKEILEQLVDSKIVPPLEDRLWKHVPQDDILPAIESDSDHEPSSTVTIPTPPRIPENDEYTGGQTPEGEKNQPISPDKEKDSSDFSGRSTPPPPKSKSSEIWRGIINMIDVAQISISAHEVSGDCSGLGRELSSNLDIVGRISPDTVWDYIGKMKCSNSKGISLIRLKATNVEEKMPYLALYSYLSSRDRLGVVKSLNKAVKDFYIYPLAPQKPIPQVLLPLNGPGFEESRPSLLLGIIVRDKRKRPYMDSLIMPSPISQSKKLRVETPPPSLPAVAVPSVPEPPPRSYTPPPAKDPRRKLPLMLPTVETTPTADEDEPYSPEDSDLDAPTPRPQPILNIPDSSIAEPTIPPPTYPSLPSISGNLPSTTFEIQRQMEELNKKIEMQKSEITSMTQNIVSASSEIGTSALASIALPSNLQQILDSIKTIGDTTDAPPQLPKESAQTDLTIPLMIPKSFSRPLGGSGPNQPPPSQYHHTKPPPDLPSDTIPLNLPVKPKIKPASINSPLTEEKSSVLSSLTEEELIKKAAEMLGEDEDSMSRKKRGDRLLGTGGPPPQKRSKMEEVILPPVPGMEDGQL